MDPHPPDKLQHATDYLELIIHMAEYDLSMIRQMPEKTFERNPFIDSLLIRLRTIIEFLYRKGRGFPSDVIALDFVPNWEPPDDRLLAEQKELIDTTLVHLSTKQMPKLISEVEFAWEDIYRHTMHALLLFFEKAPPDLVLDQARGRFRSAYALAFGGK